MGDPDIVGNLRRRLIAFDLDGTLIESRRDLADSANELIVELGGAPLTVEQVAGMVGEGARVLVSRALTAAGVPVASNALERFLEIYDARVLNHTFLYDGIAEAVQHARRYGPVAVLTNKPLRHSEKILAGLQVRALFDAVIGGDGPYPRKPDPASLRALMAGLGAAPDDTLLVGDTAIDLQAARNAGIHCCIVSYGFGFRRDRVEDADWIVDDAAGLRRVIDAWALADA